MRLSQPRSSVEAWLGWFDEHKATQYHTYLRTTWGVDPHEADVLLNTARIQIFRYWPTLTNPLAFFRTTLRHALWQHWQRTARDRQRRAAYEQYWHSHSQHTHHLAQQVADVLEQASPRHRHILTWFLEGHADQQVADWLHTTPQAVRKARSEAYRTLRSQPPLAS
jgi:DNA-directed RNA polymerase specialized sigma24 family protein